MMKSCPNDKKRFKTICTSLSMDSIIIFVAFIIVIIFGIFMIFQVLELRQLDALIDRLSKHQ